MEEKFLINIKNIIKIFLFSMFSFYTLWGNNFPKEYKIVEYALDRKFNIDKFLIRSIVEAESKFNIYAANILFKRKKYKQFFIKKLKIKNIKFYSQNSRRIRVIPQSKQQAKWLYFFLLKNNKQIRDYDLGIMQVNKQNFKKFKLSYIFFLDYKANMLAGVAILRKCYNWALRKFKNSTEREQNIYALECYNKGTNVKKIDKYRYNYYNKIVSNYEQFKKENK